MLFLKVYSHKRDIPRVKRSHNIRTFYFSPVKNFYNELTDVKSIRELSGILLVYSDNLQAFVIMSFLSKFLDTNRQGMDSVIN